MKADTVLECLAKSHWGKVSVIACACALALNGCTLPSDYEKKESITAQKLGYDKTVKEIEEINWPEDMWWMRYQDGQLDQLISEALIDSPSLKVAQARLKNAQGIAKQVGALEKLTVGAGATASLTKVSYAYQSAMPPRNWNDYGTATMDFSYSFDFWGKNRASVAAATSDYAASEAEFAEARLMVSTSVANAYAELARLYANLDTVEAALSVRQQTLELLTKRFKNGLEAKGAVSQAKSAASSVEAEVLSVEEAIALQKNAIAALIGSGPDRTQTLTRPKIQLSHTFGLPAEIGVGLLGHRPDITASRWKAEAAASRIGIARANFYPDVSLSGFIGYQAFGLDNLFNDGNSAGSIGPALYLPIFSGGRLEGQLTSAEAGYEMAVSSYNATLTNALHEVANVVTSSNALTPQVVKSREAVASAKEAHQIMSNRYKGGLSSYLEVLAAENVLISSRRALVNLETRAFNLDIALIHALGGGYQSDISQR